jgi:hypothetical protein
MWRKRHPNLHATVGKVERQWLKSILTNCEIYQASKTVSARGHLLHCLCVLLTRVGIGCCHRCSVASHLRPLHHAEAEHEADCTRTMPSTQLPVQHSLPTQLWLASARASYRAPTTALKVSEAREGAQATNPQEMENSAGEKDCAVRMGIIAHIEPYAIPVKPAVSSHSKTETEAEGERRC